MDELVESPPFQGGISGFDPRTHHQSNLNWLQNKNATVTIVHSKTKDIKTITSKADILVAAIGQQKMVKSDWVKDGAVVIDVGINRMENGKLCGDVDFDYVCDKVKAISPVPKGVGPMTVCMLLENTLESYHDKERKNG